MRKTNKITKLFLIMFLTGCFGFLPAVFAETQSNTKVKGTQINMNKRALANLNTQVIILKKQVELGGAVTIADLELLRKSIKVNGLLFARTTDELNAIQTKIANLNQIIKSSNSENEKLKTSIKKNETDIAELIVLIGTSPDPEYNILLNDNGSGRAKILTKLVVQGGGYDIPKAENCNEIGQGFFENVIIRDLNKFFVEDNGITKVCEIDLNELGWTVKDEYPGTLGHIIEVKR